MNGRTGGLGLSLAAAMVVILCGGAGCTSQATLVRTRPPTASSNGAVMDKFTSRVALFGMSERGKQTIVLAFEPTGAKVPITGPLGTDERPAPPGQYRAFLMLVVQKGGGEFLPGQRLVEGNVRAVYRVFNERNEAVLEAVDRLGTISTQSWAWMGGVSSDEWWTSGQFDLLMSNDLKLSGRFFARPAPAKVSEFLKDGRL